MSSKENRMESLEIKRKLKGIRKEVKGNQIEVGRNLNLKENQKIAYKAAAQRLIEPNEMGALFKAIALYPSKLTAPAGFDL